MESDLVQRAASSTISVVQPESDGGMAFPYSSAAERDPVKVDVLGSNPSVGAKMYIRSAHCE